MMRLSSVLHTACALLLGTVGMTVVYAKESPADFSQKVPLTLSGEGPWFSLNIPLDVQAVTNKADLRDLRVFDAQGQPQAFALITDNAQQTTSTAKEAEVRLFPLRRPVTAGAPQPDIRIEQNGTIVEVRTHANAASTDGPAQKLRGWLLDASKLDFPLERLRLNWSSADEGFQSFSIEGSDDLEHWIPWGSGQIARLAFDGERLDVSEVPLPARRAKYLRLLWPTDLAAVELKSARLLGSTRTTQPAPLLWSTPAAGRPAEKDGDLRWTLAQALPLQRVRIVLAPELKNVVVPVDLAGRDTTNINHSARPTSSSQRNEVYWSPLARGVVYRLPIDGRTTQVDELEIKDPQAVRELRLRVDSRGTGFGGQPPMLSYAMNGSRLVFLAQGQAPYQLAYGNAKVQAANLPLSVLIPGYSESKPPVLGKAELSAATVVTANAAAIAAANTATKAQAENVAQVQDWKKIGLWSVLLLGVGLLFLMAMSLVKKKPEA